MYCPLNAHLGKTLQGVEESSAGHLVPTYLCHWMHILDPRLMPLLLLGREKMVIGEDKSLAQASSWTHGARTDTQTPKAQDTQPSQSTH